MPAHIIGIRRARVFSPNSVERDALIAQAVAHELEARAQCTVQLVCEEELCHMPPPVGCAGVFSMARGAGALQWLRGVQAQGVPVVNAPDAVAAATRRRIDSLSRVLGVPRPHCVAGGPETAAEDWCTGFPCWLKRDDGCAQQQADVVYCADGAALREALHHLRSQGVEHWVAEQHVAGDVLKFYGVLHTPFFYVAGGALAYSKFGHEAINGAYQGYAYSASALERHARALAEALGIEVFGGDAVITPGGEALIIDFNDWPSFSSCRSQAAASIVSRIINRMGLSTGLEGSDLPAPPDTGE